MKHLIPFLLLLAALPCAAQESLRLIREAKHGSGMEEARSLAPLPDGSIALTGSSFPYRKSGKDVLFGILNEDFSVRGKLHVIGREGDDMGHKIIADWDGTLLIAGSSEKPGGGASAAAQKRYFGKKDAWLLKVNPGGKIVWDKLFGGPGDDEWLGADIDPDGNYYLAGYKGEHFWLAKIDRKGEIVWERTPSFGDQSRATCVKWLQNGEIAVAGYSESKAKTELVAAKYQADGKLVWSKTFPGAQAADIAELPGGALAITGTEFNARLMDQMLLLTLSKEGTERWRKSYGAAFGPDAGKSLLRSWDGHFYLVGDNNSYSKTARRNMLWLQKTSPEGAEKMPRPLLFGEKSENQGFSVALDNDGTLLVAGMASSPGARQAWIMRFSDGLANNAATPENASVRWISFTDENGDGALDPGERGYFLFSVSNTHPSLPLAGLYLDTPPPGPHFDFSFPGKYYLGLIPPGETRYYSLPLQAVPTAKKSETSVEIRLSGPAQRNIETYKVSIFTNDQPQARLQLLSSQLLVDGAPATQVEKDKTLVLKMEIANVGGATAADIFARFDWPDWVRPSAVMQFPQQDLDAGESVSVQISFRIANAFDAAYLSLSGALNCGDCPESAPLNWRWPLAARQAAAPAATASEIFLEWIEPDPFRSTGGVIPSKTASIPIAIRARSSVPLASTHFTIYVNDAPVGAHEKFDGIQLKALSQSGANRMGSYQFESEVKLREGTNRIVVVAESGGARSQSEPLVISYTGKKPNLHLIAIGIPARDLMYTSRDAEEIARAFEGQEGKIFGKVHISRHTTEATTTVTALRKIFETKKREYDHQLIDENDVMIVYISSHGKTNREKEGFLIPCSDYEPVSYESTSLDFQNDIVGRLERIKCQKFLFIDACHSGSAFYDEGIKGLEDDESAVLSEALDKLMRNKGLHILSSCSPKEKSYELPALKISAFTKAILEAFDGEPVALKNGRQLNPNTDRDRFLTFSELLQFVKVRVPDLILTHRGSGDQQNPSANLNDENIDLPFYYYGY